MNQTLFGHFKSLRSLELISEEQYQLATTHERLMTLTTVESDADALFHSAFCGVVTEQELEELEARLAATPESDPRQSEKLAIVGEALGLIETVIRNLIREPLDALLALDLINAEQHEASLDIRPQRAEGVMDTPARALAILVNRGIVVEERLTELKAQMLENPQGANAEQRLAIVTEAEAIYLDIVGQYVNTMGGGAMRLFGLIMLVIVGGIGMALWLGK